MSSRQQLKQLQLALISAFPSRALLERLLYFELEKNLNEITRESDLQETVFKLIKTAESQGWLVELVRAARKENPGNSELEAIALKLLSPETSSVSVTVAQPKQEQQGIKSISNITAEFDVFLCHNSEDKEAIIEIAERLKSEYKIKPWLDVWELRPGLPWQPELEKQINHVKSAAIFVGQSGIGPWQRREIESFLRQFVNRECPVIPVLLPDTPKQPTLPFFLADMTWVDFRQQKRYVDPMDSLVWGITGQKPEPTVKVIPQPSNDLNSNRTLDYMRSESEEPPQIDDLSSDRSIDYTRLRDLLTAVNWKDADYETYSVMLKVVGRKDGDWIRDEELLNFPCTDLRTIDSLWVKYSDGRFGFSVQKKIYIEVGGIPDGRYDEEAWLVFGARVGWRVRESWITYSKVIFDTTVPVGHLPYTKKDDPRTRTRFPYIDLSHPSSIPVIIKPTYTQPRYTTNIPRGVFSRIQTCSAIRCGTNPGNQSVNNPTSHNQISSG